ncbi:hypothetical protein RE2895_23760 [Rhodococcus erythropolis]|nr:hypothetical protein RE2895_23760 [Rhodococcus erythropolis]
MTTHYNYNPEGVPLSHHEDSEEQLVIGSERDFIDLQEPELVRSIGAAALRRAQEQLGVYFHCLRFTPKSGQWSRGHRGRGQ